MKIKTFGKILPLVGLCLLKAEAALAAPLDYFDPGSFLGGSGVSTESPVDITLNIISAFLSIFGIITVVLIIYGGFTILTSGGNDEKVQKGRQILFWAIIGAVVILSSLGIVSFIDAELFGTASTTTGT
ncbi:pilin [Patescibacteria group bacterium]